MSDATLDKLIGEIAQKHGVIVGREDPIMILQTMNDRLLRENAVAHDEALQGFRAELEELTHTWGNELRRHSEAMLSAALSASTNQMEGFARAAGEGVQREMRRTLAEQKEMVGQARRAAWISAGGAVVALVAVIVLVVGLASV